MGNLEQSGPQIARDDERTKLLQPLLYDGAQPLKPIKAEFTPGAGQVGPDPSYISPLDAGPNKTGVNGPPTGEVIQPRMPWRYTPGADVVKTYRPGKPIPPGQNPNDNGVWTMQHPQLPGSHPAEPKGPTWVTTADFWQDQDAYVDGIGRKLGHRTYNYIAPLVIGGIGGRLGSAEVPNVAHYYAKRFLDGKDPTLDPTAPEGVRQRWARAWEKGYTPATKAADELTRIDDQISNTRENVDDLRQQRAALSQSAKDKAIEQGWMDKDGKKIAQPTQAQVDEFQKLRNQVTELDREINEAVDQTGRLGRLRFSQAAQNAQRVASEHFGGIYRGVGAAAISVAIDTYADRLDDKFDQKNGINLTSGLLMPMALGFGQDKKTWAMRGALFGVGLGASWLGSWIDKQPYIGAQPGEALTGDRFRPNTVDTLSVGVAAGFPGGLKERVPLALSGWMEGRALNTQGLESVAWTGASLLPLIRMPEGARGVGFALAGTGIAMNVLNKVLDPHETMRELNKSAWDALRQDETDRTSTSLNAAVDKFTTLGSKYPDGNIVSNFVKLRWDNNDDGFLSLYYADWATPGKEAPFAPGTCKTDVPANTPLCVQQGDDPSPLDQLRGRLILGLSAAEARLARGTAPQQTSKDVGEGTWHPHYVKGLDGLDLDLGADAYRRFEVARVAKDQAIEETKRLVANNTPGVKASEVDALQSMDKRIQEGEDKILRRAHDIPKALDALADYFEDSTTDASHLSQRLTLALNNAERIKSANTGQNPKDVEFQAKLARDAALVKMAYAIKAARGGGRAFGENPENAEQALAGGANPNYGISDPLPGGAGGLIEYAAKLDPNNPDLPALRQMLKEAQARVRTEMAAYRGRTKQFNVPGLPNQ